MKCVSRLYGAIISTMVSTVCLAAGGDMYPVRPVRLVVGFSAGGSSDTAARIAGQRLTELLGQSVVVDNRTGANGAIAGELVAKAPADGYTLLMITIAYATETALGGKLPYDMSRDFAPVTQVTQQPYLVVVTPSLPANSIPELIALAKSKPNQLNYGSTGTGGSNHLTTELFSVAAGIHMTHVPYKGPPPALAAVAAGELQLMFSSIVSGLPLTRIGKLRALAVSSRARSSVVPEIPAIAESLPGFESVGWNGIMAPKGTPQSVVQRLATAVANGMRNENVRARLAADGSEAVASTPEEFSQFLKHELARYRKVIRDTGIAVEP
jgi:tripartite-type tricarboxylate transporter receptor subunit TctC